MTNNSRKFGRVSGLYSRCTYSVWQRRPLYGRSRYLRSVSLNLRREQSCMARITIRSQDSQCAGVHRPPVTLTFWKANSKSNIQTKDAKRLLGIIAQAVTNGELLTYRYATLAMNRTPPQDHARTVAQMCDLLDAAACLAGALLLALVAVREKSREINPKAWKKEFGPRRDAITRLHLQRARLCCYSFRDRRSRWQRKYQGLAVSPGRLLR